MNLAPKKIEEYRGIADLVIAELLTDDETNGLMSYDREVSKIKRDEFLDISEKIGQSTAYTVPCPMIRFSEIRDRFRGS